MQRPGEVVVERGVGRGRQHLGGVDHGPPVDPVDAGEEGLAAVDVERRAESARAHAEVDHRPRSVGVLDQVGVAGVLHGRRRAAPTEDRIGRARLERPLDRARPGDRDGVPALGAALGDEQVPPAVAAVEVRALGVGEPGPLPHGSRGLEHLGAREVDARLRDDRQRPAVGRSAGSRPQYVSTHVPSSSQARSGSIPPRPVSTIGSDHGPAGSVAVTTNCSPGASTFVVTSQKTPSRWRRVGA